MSFYTKITLILFFILSPTKDLHSMTSSSYLITNSAISSYDYEKASKYIDINQLGIAPQCGFSSTEEGNTISYDDQRRKLELVIKIAEYIWNEI